MASYVLKYLLILDILMEATIQDRIMLLMGLKEEGRWVDFGHIYEKVSRDEVVAGRPKPSYESFAKSLAMLVDSGLLEVKGEKYRITDAGRNLVAEIVVKKRPLNRSYILVWKAQRYYEKFADHILPFLKGRPVSAVKVFTDESDPFGKVKPIFVRYARYKPRPVFLRVETEERLIELVYDHAIDFIPYVHKEGAKEPDIFLIDLDPGEGLRDERGFLLTKKVALASYELLKELGVKTMVKFSGSRGFQLICSLDNSGLKGDIFDLYRRIIRAFQTRLEERLKGEDMPGPPPYTTSQVKDRKARANLVLVDWSSMKPMGDYRAPFSIHYRTGLVSLPLKPEKIMEFEKGDAEPLSLLKAGVEKWPPFKPQNPEGLISLLKEQDKIARFLG